MRPIDADALNSVKFHSLPYTHITPSDADAEAYKRGWNDAIDAIIEDAPTIEPSPNCSELPKSSDCISRQAAIDAFGLSEKTRKYGGDHSGYDTRMLYEIQDVLEGLPPADPDIIRCKDCKHYNGEDRDICCPLADYAQSKCGADWFCADGKRRDDEAD